MILDDLYYEMDADVDRYAWSRLPVFDENDQWVANWELDKPRRGRLIVKLTNTRPLGDCLGVSGDTLLSERAMRVFRENARCWEAIVWVPVIVLAMTSILGRYWWLRYRREDIIDALDVSRSEPALSSDGTILLVNKWVLDEKAARGLDLFCPRHAESWFASRKIRELVALHDLKGFQFRPLMVWRDEPSDGG